ncbi:MAG: hypothetical protein ABIV51_07375 [Saprospiraceae bacterium]
MSRMIIFPFLILAGILFYCLYVLEMEFLSIYLVPCVVIPVGVTIFAPQIDWWWMKKHPPKMPVELKHFLLEHNEFYANLKPIHKKKFEGRVLLYMWAREFIPKEIEKVPDDIRMICAQYAVQLSLNQSDYLLGDNDRVVMYKHPFISPRYPSIFHGSEYYAEDGVLIFSLDRILPGFIEPTLYFPAAAYEYAKLYLHLKPDESPTSLQIDEFRSKMGLMGFQELYVKEFLAIPDIDWAAVSLVYYFIFNESFKTNMPTLEQYFADIFQPKIQLSKVL